MPRQILIASDFTRGLNDSIDPDRLADNELAGALNMRPNLTGNIVSRDGQEQVSTGSFSTGGTAHITSFFEGTISTGTISAIATVNTDGATSQRFYHVDSNNIKTNLTVTASGPANRLWRWVLFNDLFIGVAEGWPVMKWTGTSSSALTELGGVASANITAPTDVAIWNGRVCIAQGVDLYFSDASEAEDFLGGDSQVIRFRGALFGEEDITAIYPFNGKLLVFKTSSIWSISPGEGPAASWTVDQVAFGVGCDAKLSIADLGRDLIFLSVAGFNSLANIVETGGVAVDGRVSQKIHRTQISNINSLSISNAVAVYNPDREEYMCSLPIGTSTANSKVLVLSTRFTNIHQDSSWWPFEYTYDITAFCRRKSAGLERIQAGAVNGHLYDLTSSTNADGSSTAFEKYITTKRFPFGNFTDNKVFQKISVDITQEQSFDVDIEVRFNGSSRLKSYITNIVGTGAQYDVSLWDSVEWVNVFKGADRRDIFYVARNIQVKISESINTESVTINKILFEYEPIAEDLAL